MNSNENNQDANKQSNEDILANLIDKDIVSKEKEISSYSNFFAIICIIIIAIANFMKDNMIDSQVLAICLAGLAGGSYCKYKQDKKIIDLILLILYTLGSLVSFIDYLNIF